MIGRWQPFHDLDDVALERRLREENRAILRLVREVRDRQQLLAAHRAQCIKLKRARARRARTTSRPLATEPA